MVKFDYLIIDCRFTFGSVIIYMIGAIITEEIGGWVDTRVKRTVAGGEGARDGARVGDTNLGVAEEAGDVESVYWV